MKKIFLICIASAGLMACASGDKKADNKPIADSTAPKPAPAAKLTTIQWLDSTTIDLGKHKQGKSIDVAFRFKNSGTEPLIFIDGHAACGCTDLQLPKQPFAPGEEGVIKAVYNGSGDGKVEKQITVETNTEKKTEVLTFNVFMEK